ncbi:MAG: hypothetical protein ACAH07_01905 [Methylophilaceae bacterium]|nr:hypothetical protein [Methyloradius sp.]
MSEIMHLETLSWPAELCATESKILQRLAWQHVVLGARENDKLIGMAGWRYASFQPNKNFPTNFDLFANLPNDHNHNAAFAYNFAIAPTLRKSRLGSEVATGLIMEGIKILLQNKCRFLVGASRCPTYAGNNDGYKENLNIKNPDIYSAIDHCITSQLSPIDDTLPWQSDPILSFYKQALDCVFLKVLPGFMPEDIASGGHAIAFYKLLE